MGFWVCLLHVHLRRQQSKFEIVELPHKQQVLSKSWNHMFESTNYNKQVSQVNNNYVNPVVFLLVFFLQTPYFPKSIIFARNTSSFPRRVQMKIHSGGAVQAKLVCETSMYTKQIFLKSAFWFSFVNQLQTTYFTDLVVDKGFVISPLATIVFSSSSCSSCRLTN